MKVRTRILLLLAFLIVSLFAVLLFIRHWQWANMALVLKNREEEVQQLFDKIVDLKGKSLYTLCYDYTFWDEMVKFVETGDPVWQKEILDASLQIYDADALWVYKPDCQLLHFGAVGTDTLQAEDLGLSPDQIRALFAEKPLVHFYVKTPRGVADVNGATIHSSDDQERKKAVHGYFFVSALMDKEYLGKLSDLVRGQVETLEQTTYDVPGAEKGANGLLILHRILPGWDDGPVAVMRSRIYAPLVQQFVQASRWGFFWGAILASAIVAGLCLTLLRWTVRPLYDLSMSLDHEETRFLQRYKKQDNEYGHIARLIERFFEQKRSLITEVYERGKAEEALRTERDQAQLYLDTAGVLMTVIDGHGHIQLVNRQGCRILGYEPGELVGRNVFDACLPPGEGEEARTEFENILRSGDISSRSFEAVVITKTGERRTLSFQSALLPAGGGKGRLLVSGEDVTEQLAAQESLEFMQYAIDKAAEAVYWILPDAAFYYVNESACKCLGYTRDELLGMRVMDIDPEMDDECWAQHWQEVYQRRSFTIESAHKTKSGETFPVEVTVNFIELNDKQFNIAFVRDITGRKAAEAEKERLEEHVRQVQKIESIGWLAGGVAHDFNNLLSPIIGYSDLILERTEQGDPLRDEMSQIKMAAERGAILTRQLLAFGRRQMLDMKNQQLNEVVLAFEKMLCRIIGEDIELVFNPQPGLWDIRADAGQLEQVLMNLAANARDAMPGGGKISIATSNEIMDEERIEGRPMKPGSYVTLTFSDTGYGIDEAHLGRIFEPFFTTKPADKGSGLGLAMVYGIIKQHGAFIWVSSQPGEGSVFRIHFPAVFDTPVELAAPVPTVVKKVGGEETILVVEDEEPVRNLVVEILRINGYNVLSASNPVEAITLSEEYAGQIDLLLSDVIMPQMNGKELYHRLAFCRPDIKILYMSGYTGDTVLSYGIMDVGLQFLQKPFTLQALTQKVRQVLDSA